MKFRKNLGGIPWSYCLQRRDGSRPIKNESYDRVADTENAKALRGFLGLTGYYRKFVQDYGKISAPLMALLRKDAWRSPDADVAFNNLKTAMSTWSTSILALPNFNKLFVVECDASGIGIGGVLMEEGRPLAFTSKALSRQHQNLSVYDKEMMAIVHAVAKWRPYLLGQHSKIRTDHRSLKYIMEQDKWLSKLRGYDYEIVYKKGTENVVTDALSRLPEYATIAAISVPVYNGPDDIREEWANDTAAQSLIRRLQEDPNAVPHYTWDTLDLKHKGRIVLVDNSVQKPIIVRDFHASPSAGHSGFLRTYKRISRAFYWKGMKKEIKHFVEECHGAWY